MEGMNGREKVEMGKHKKESVSLSQWDLIQSTEREFKYIDCYKEVEEENMLHTQNFNLTAVCTRRQSRTCQHV